MTKITNSPSKLTFHFFCFLSIPERGTNLMITSMDPHSLLPLLFLPLLATLLARAFAAGFSGLMYPFNCSERITTCNSSLYQNNGLQIEQTAYFYSVNTSQINGIPHNNKQDYLVTVPCSCKEINGTVGYFYDAVYHVQPNDTFVNVSAQIYSGQAWEVGGEERSFRRGANVSMHLLCGCVENDAQTVITYTVQQHDTLTDIATLLSAEQSGIERMNRILTQNPNFIDVGWVLFVPKENNGIQALQTERRQKWTIVIGILSTVTLLSMCTMIVLLVRRFKCRKNDEEDAKAVSRSMIAKRTLSLQKQFLPEENIEDVTAFESERPVILSLEDIEEATNYFDEARKIGEGGYGSVYFGMLGKQEVAIKKMRSNESKEFFAELKVLCKIHHINVVELLGYASGDDHLYLVYEYVQNGSLSSHLHDPLLKGNQPLSWTARTQIALDAARGIEYIHDHTKARYVHRDIKTSNILLDEGLRAKVADFGLAKLVKRTNEDDLIATRLVGTPGYLPPESVTELQVTSKTDVFAFGVVLAELITGQRALIRGKTEPNKMKSLITIVNEVFQDEDPETALELVIDGNLKPNHPMEDVFKMAEIAHWCLSENALDRPEMREIIATLSRIMLSSVGCEASVGGNSQVFSGIFNGR